MGTWKRFRLFCRSTIGLSLWLICGSAAHAELTLTTLVSFDYTNGWAPKAELIQGADGDFYGTNSEGGAHTNEFGVSLGTVFRITKDGVLTTLVSFNGTNGAFPESSLLQSLNGVFYGTTYLGGTNDIDIEGGGTVFKMTADGTLTSLFSCSSDAGYRPRAGLTIGDDGNFYGTASEGGPFDAGSVYRMAPSGALITLIQFDGTNGANPLTELVQRPGGSFCGATWELGPDQDVSHGTIFKISSNGILTLVIPLNFTNGSNPTGLIQGTDGNLYGTTFDGGAYTNQYGQGFGTVFRLATDGNFSTLVSFAYTNGCGPNKLVEGNDGNFYGTTYFGGAYGGQTENGYGTVFKMARNGTLDALLSFNKTNGAHPSAGLVQAKDGNFYGTTESGGLHNRGTIFRVSVPLAPKLEPGMQIDGSIGLRWRSVAGQTYQLQFNSDLNSTNWENFGVAIAATNGTVSASDSFATNQQRYYRVVLLP
jgi:uncharacterized repeat protein (TIGR03803 family)